jgi:hypothetical protein
MLLISLDPCIIQSLTARRCRFNLKHRPCHRVSHGFYASYNELRRYLTSLADHEINKIENGTYIPHGICSLPGEVTLITFSLLAEENALDFA